MSRPKNRAATSSRAATPSRAGSLSRAAALQRTTGRIIRQISGAIAVIAFSPFEEEFFREGDQLATPPEAVDLSDLDAGFQRPTLWRAVVGWLKGERTEHPE
jgi:hypothetical protein